MKIAGEALALMAIAFLFIAGLWIPYLSAAPSNIDVKYEVKK